MSMVPMTRLRKQKRTVGVNQLDTYSIMTERRRFSLPSQSSREPYEKMLMEDMCLCICIYSRYRLAAVILYRELAWVISKY